MCVEGADVLRARAFREAGGCPAPWGADRMLRPCPLPRGASLRKVCGGSTPIPGNGFCGGLPGSLLCPADLVDEFLSEFRNGVCADEQEHHQNDEDDARKAEVTHWIPALKDEPGECRPRSVSGSSSGAPLRSVLPRPCRPASQVPRAACGFRGERGRNEAPRLFHRARRGLRRGGSCPARVPAARVFWAARAIRFPGCR